MRRRFSGTAIAAFLCLLAALSATAHAQGGPPFRTDDPETPGNKHWEINFGWIGDRNPAAGAYQVPDFDINYGLGDRIQLKYEIPIAIEETRPQPATNAQPAVNGNVVVGLGESLLGVKIRFYEHHPGDPWFGRNPPSKPPADAAAGTNSAERVVDFSVGTYPQLFLNNPTSAVSRGVVASGPNFLLPLEANARIGPVRLDGEVGYNFGNHALPQSWIRGLLVGHEFTDRTEAYLEIYDEQDANRLPPGFRVAGTVRDRRPEAARGHARARRPSGAQSLQRTLVLLLMGGRSFQTISVTNSQPSWIAYVGVQVLLGPAEPVMPQVEQKLPNEGP
jgi:hypothetical protein